MLTVGVSWVIIIPRHRGYDGLRLTLFQRRSAGSRSFLCLFFLSLFTKQVRVGDRRGVPDVRVGLRRRICLGRESRWGGSGTGGDRLQRGVRGYESDSPDLFGCTEDSPFLLLEVSLHTVLCGGILLSTIALAYTTSVDGTVFEGEPCMAGKGGGALFFPGGNGSLRLGTGGAPTWAGRPRRGGRPLFGKRDACDTHRT